MALQHTYRTTNYTANWPTYGAANICTDDIETHWTAYQPSIRSAVWAAHKPTHNGAIIKTNSSAFEPAYQ